MLKFCNQKGECSKLIFLITSVLFINRLTLVCNGFIVLNHISSKQVMVVILNRI